MNSVKIRALLVEDSQILARFLTEVLELQEGRNLEIVHTESLAGAADLMKQQEFDVLLLDLSLPDSSGMDTIIRAQVLAPRTPIVVLSAADDELARAEAVRHGAHAYLVKGDAQGEQIMQVIRQAVERRRSQTEQGH